jgi:hypothetical protein
MTATTTITITIAATAPLLPPSSDSSVTAFTVQFKLHSTKTLLPIEPVVGLISLVCAPVVTAADILLLVDVDVDVEDVDVDVEEVVEVEDVDVEVEDVVEVDVDVDVEVEVLLDEVEVAVVTGAPVVPVKC